MENQEQKTEVVKPETPVEAQLTPEQVFMNSFKSMISTTVKDAVGTVMDEKLGEITKRLDDMDDTMSDMDNKIDDTPTDDDVDRKIERSTEYFVDSDEVDNRIEKALDEFDVSQAIKDEIGDVPDEARVDEMIDHAIDNYDFSDVERNIARNLDIDYDDLAHSVDYDELANSLDEDDIAERVAKILNKTPATLPPVEVPKALYEIVLQVNCTEQLAREVEKALQIAYKSTLSTLSPTESVGFASFIRKDGKQL